MNISTIRTTLKDLLEIGSGDHGDAGIGLFVAQGMDKTGTPVRLEVAAISEEAARADLRRQGIRITRIKKKAKPIFAFAGKARVKPKDIALFTRQLAILSTAGVPLVQSIDIVGRGHENPSMQDLLMSIKANVEGGNSLAESLSRHPEYFDELYCNLVQAGEQAGVLEGLLHKIAEYKEKTESIKAKIKKALTYPIAVLMVAIIVTSILLIFVVPQFEELFKGFGADLPAFTQLVVNMSRFIQKYWWLFMAALAVLAYVFIRLKTASKSFNHALDRLTLKIPVLGGVIRKSSIARFARTLSTLSAAGVPLVEALQSVAGATGNIVYGEAVLAMRREVATGHPLQRAMRQSGIFPNMVVQMAAIGEESGSLDSMLAKVADFHEEEVGNAVDSLSSLLEPMIMAVLGFLVGGLIVAMYLPVFKLGSAI